MKRRSGIFRWIFFLAIVSLSLLGKLEEDREVTKILHDADIAAQDLTTGEIEHINQGGRVDAVSSNWFYTTKQLQRTVAKMPKNRRYYFYTWSADNQKEMTGSASGVDKKPYFVNSFLLGYKPFSTNSVWEPLATIALRKSYILDHKLYGPHMADIWQNSKQAYLATRGDCEDHAIILADWLIAEGHDARVVLGTYESGGNSGGHAWVVLFKDNKEYILESTSKKRPRSINDFILASMSTDYRPMVQFDREHYWVNTGSKMTTRYRDSKWKLRSKFASS